jgi:hypothetical protein
MLSHKSEQSGNMLFIILIAIILLGGLAVLLSRTSGSTDDTGSTEKATIQATDIVRYLAGVEAGIARLMNNGCSETQISFYSPKEPSAYMRGEYGAISTPADKSCYVFDPAGAGIEYKLSSDFSAASITYAGEAGIAGYRSDVKHLIAFLTNIPLPLCIALNKVVGMPLSSAGQPLSLQYGVTAGPFKGLYNNAGTVSVVGATGRKAGCALGNSTGAMPGGQYSFYYSLTKR